MRACHYVKGDNGERVLIPGCWGTVDYPDMRFCTCGNTRRKRKKMWKLVDDIEEMACKRRDEKTMAVARELRDLMRRAFDEQAE